MTERGQALSVYVVLDDRDEIVAIYAKDPNRPIVTDITEALAKKLASLSGDERKPSDG